MSEDAPSKGRTIATWILRVILGILFLAVGATKLTGAANTVEYFAAIGWGQWLRYLTGFIDIAGAALLFVPRWTFYGAMAIACSVGLASVISLTVLRNSPAWGGSAMAAAPLALTLAAITLALLTRYHKVPRTGI